MTRTFVRGADSRSARRARLALVVLPAASLGSGLILTLRSLHRISAAARRISGGDLDVRLPQGGLSRAVPAFNDMAAALARHAAQDHDRQSDILSATARAQALTSISALLLGAPSGVGAVADLAVQIVADVLGDGASLRLFDDGDESGPGRPDGEESLRSGWCAHRDPVLRAVLRECAARHLPDLLGMFPSLVTGEMFVAADATTARAWGAALTSGMDVEATLAAQAFLPVRAQGSTIGVLALFRKPSATLSAAEVEFAREIAARVAQALVTARLVAELEREVELRRAAEREATSALARQRELLARLEDIERRERHAIAADIHDDPVQVLSAALMALGTAKLSPRQDMPSRISEAEVLISSATDRLRGMIFQLAPTDLSRVGLETGLGRLCADIFGNTGVAGNVVVQAAVPPHTAEVLFQICREALLNVRKHADARAVRIRVRRRAGGTTLSVKDDGPRKASVRDIPVGGHGIFAMSERAEAAGGWLRVVATRRGTSVLAWLPAGRT